MLNQGCIAHINDLDIGMQGTFSKLAGNATPESMATMNRTEVDCWNEYVSGKTNFMQGGI